MRNKLLILLLFVSFAFSQSAKVYWLGNEPDSKLTADEVQALATFADAIEGTSTYDTGSSSLAITDIFTERGASAHKSISVDLTYTPSAAGAAAPIGIASKVTLTSGMTYNSASDNYQGLGFGVQGQIHFPTGAAYVGQNATDPGMLFAAVRGVLTDAGTSTYTYGTMTAAYLESQVSQDVTTGSFRHFLLWLRNQGSSTATNIDAAIYIDEGNAWTNTIQTGIDINNTVKGLDIMATTTGIDFSSSMTQEIIGQNDETIDNATNGSWDFGAADLIMTGGDLTGANGNAIDIGEATDGTITFSRDDSGAIILTSADDDADADLTLVPGGTGNLLLGDAGGTVQIASSDWAISTAGVQTNMGNITSDGTVKSVDADFSGDLYLDTTKKLVFADDGDDHTYILESGADVLDTYVGGVLSQKITESTTISGVLYDVWDVTGAFTAASMVSDAGVSGTVITGTAEALFTNNAASVTFGAVGTDADVVLAFDAVSNQGSITYMEDEDRFDFNNDVSVGGSLTAVSGVDLGTSQSLTGTTAMTIGDGTQTVTINTSAWNIDDTGLLSGVVVYSDANGETLNNATGFTSYSAVSALNRSVFTFTNYSMVITDALGTGGHGAIKLIDFPEGYIRIDGIIGDIEIESQTGSANNAAFDMALGTATTNTGIETLAGTSVDILGKVDGTLSSGTDTIDLIGVTTQNQDGTSGSTDIWLDVAIEDTFMSTDGTLVFSGTIVVVWWSIGDY